MSLHPGRNGGGVEGARKKGEWQCTGRILMTYYHSRSTPGHAMQASPPRPGTHVAFAFVRCSVHQKQNFTTPSTVCKMVKCTKLLALTSLTRSKFSRSILHRIQFSFKARRWSLYFAPETSALRRWSGVDSLLSLNIHPGSPCCRAKPTPTVSEEVLALWERGDPRHWWCSYFIYSV